MRKGKLFDIIYHPAFISLIIWFVLVLFIPLSVSRYRIMLVSEEAVNPNTYIMFCDIDSDGASERISLDLGDAGQTKVIVYKGDKVMDQYNVAYQPSNIQSVYFGDYNDDTCKEIYIFTLNDNTLYLSVLDPAGQRNALIYNRQIDYWKKPSQSTDRPNFAPVGMIVNSVMQSKDLIFFISTGYSVQPRNLYRYIISSDSLIKSPQSFATINQCIMAEIPGISSDYTFLLSTQATGNVDETPPYSDLHSWLMVLNGDLEFSFNPVNIGVYPSILQAIPLNVRGKTMFLLMHDYFGTDDTKSMFYIYDHNGNKIKEKEIEDYEPVFSNIFPNESDEGKTFFFLKNQDGVVVQLDTTFNTIDTYTLPALASGKPIACLDADMDGSKEYFFLGRGYRSLVVSKENFRDAVEYSLQEESSNYILSPLLTHENDPLIYIQSERHGQFISYEKNPFFYLRVPFLIAVYLFTLLFISILYRIQKHRIELRLATEKELASLQMRAIKNQIDPHFTLNVLNSIGSLYHTEASRQKADYIFGKYATLIRQTVISSDKVIITLEEEVDFVRNYIDIECFRFDNSFEYSINIDSAVDLEVKIPRMLIHTFIENSVKYGLRRRAEGGKLKLEIRQNAGTVAIMIEDNGPGLSVSRKDPQGTGKGLNIVNELTDLYYRLEKIRITSSLNNIEGPKGEILGTRATILLPLNNS